MWMLPERLAEKSLCPFVRRLPGIAQAQFALTKKAAKAAFFGG